MAVDEDRMAVDEQVLEQDETQEKQVQQKKEEEECEDSEDDIEVFEEEEEDLEDIYMLLKPFTRKQLYDLSKHAFEKHHCGDVDGVVYKACRLVVNSSGQFRPPLDPQIYDKEDRTMEEWEMLVSLNWREANLHKFLEVFAVWELEAFVRICVNKLPLFADYVRKLADENPAHKTILVRSHGFGWDATPESLVSEFANYGDIAEIYYNNHVTDHYPKINCCASILFKRWSSACHALRQQPVVNKPGLQLTVVKKIGNRTTVSTLAPFGVHFCRCLHNNQGVQDPEVLSWLDTPLPNQTRRRLVPVQVRRPDCSWIPWENSLHGSLDHFFLQMDRVGKMEEKPDAIMNAVVSYNPLVDPTVSKQFEWVCKSSSQLLENPPVMREMGEKPEVVVNAMVTKNIHDDIASSILSKLPGKSLKRFGCVCKSWSHLFENPHFMSMYHNNSTHKYLLLDHRSLLCSLLNEKFDTREPVAFPPHLFPMSDTFVIMGSSSANGILGLWFLKNNEAVLWNPFTKEIKIVPPSLVEFESPYRKRDILYHGFGYDSGEDDYKLIRYAYFCEFSRIYSMQNVSLEPLWEIYSLKSDSWKKLGCKMPPGDLYCNFAKLCTGGVCHWLGEMNKSLVSFDLSKENFLKTDTPPEVWCDEGERLLGEINGHVALIASYGAQTKTTIEVSTLNKLGEEGSWTKLFIVGPLPYVANRLIGVGKGGDIFFYVIDDGVAWFDVSTCQIVHLGLKQPCRIVTYKDNLESLISRGFEKYDDEDIVNVGQITKVYESERGKCRKVQKEDSVAML